MIARPNIESVKAMLVDALDDPMRLTRASLTKQWDVDCICMDFGQTTFFIDANKLAATIIERFHQHYENEAVKAGGDR